MVSLLTVCDSRVPLNVNSSDQVNILNLSNYDGFANKPTLLTQRHPKLKTHNEENIEIIGLFIATVTHKEKKHKLQVVVVPKGRQSPIGPATVSDYVW